MDWPRLYTITEDEFEILKERAPELDLSDKYPVACRALIIDERIVGLEVSNALDCIISHDEEEPPPEIISRLNRAASGKLDSAYPWALMDQVQIWVSDFIFEAVQEELAKIREEEINNHI